jgi:hypothetical protein
MDVLTIALSLCYQQIPGIPDGSGAYNRQAPGHIVAGRVRGRAGSQPQAQSCIPLTAPFDPDCQKSSAGTRTLAVQLQRQAATQIRPTGSTGRHTEERQSTDQQNKQPSSVSGRRVHTTSGGGLRRKMLILIGPTTKNRGHAY